jgi:hypothetical protein
MSLDPSLPTSYHNLFNDYSACVPANDQLLLVMYALGGTDIPDILLKSVRIPQRRWNADGEIQQTDAAQFGLPHDLIDLICDESKFSDITAQPYITSHVRSDNTITWSLSPMLMSTFADTLLAPTLEELTATALKLLCFVCPLCYEGNTDW